MRSSQGQVEKNQGRVDFSIQRKGDMLSQMLSKINPCLQNTQKKHLPFGLA